MGGLLAISRSAIGSDRSLDLLHVEPSTDNLDRGTTAHMHRHLLLSKLIICLIRDAIVLIRKGWDPPCVEKTTRASMGKEDANRLPCHVRTSLQGVWTHVR
jgi:hypothetical protein